MKYKFIYYMKYTILKKDNWNAIKSVKITSNCKKKAYPQEWSPTHLNNEAVAFRNRSKTADLLQRSSCKNQFQWQTNQY